MKTSVGVRRRRIPPLNQTLFCLASRLVVAVRGTLLALLCSSALCVGAHDLSRVLVLRAQHLRRTRRCRAAHAQPLASCGAPLRSEWAPSGAHGSRTDATSSLSRHSSGCPCADFHKQTKKAEARQKVTILMTAHLFRPLSFCLALVSGI